MGLPRLQVEAQQRGHVSGGANTGKSRIQKPGPCSGFFVPGTSRDIRHFRPVLGYTYRTTSLLEYAMTSITGIGQVRTRDDTGTPLFCIEDIVAGLGRTTPGKVFAHRGGAVVRAKTRDGRRVLHYVDVTGAVIMIATSRGIERETITAAIASLLLEAYRATRRRERGAFAAPNLTDPRCIEPRVLGTTVGKAIRRLGLRDEVAPSACGKFVSERYQGDREQTPDGVVYADEAQVERLITQYRQRQIDKVDAD